MARGGYRTNSGRTKGTKQGEGKPKVIDGEPIVPADIRVDAYKAQLDPLEYMLEVMNDQEAHKERRDRMAIAAAPFCHLRAGEKGVGKKEREAQAAKDASGGKFAPMKAPETSTVVQ